MNKLLAFLSGCVLTLLLFPIPQAHASFGITQAGAFTTQTAGNASTTQLTVTNSAYLATASGAVGIASSSPAFPLSVLGNSYINGNYIHLGNASPNNTFCILSTAGCGELWGSDNTTSGVQFGTGNANSGTSAYNGYFLNSDLASNGLTNHYGFLGLTSSGYTDTTFGTAQAIKNLLFLQNTDGPLSFFSSTTTSPGYINFLTGGTAVANERLRIDVSGNTAVAGTLYVGSTTLSAAVGEIRSRVALTPASTTPCAIQSPAATSSLMHFAFNVTTGTSSAGIVQIATSSTAFATTSPIYNATIASGAQATLTWSAGANNSVVRPSTWVVAGMTNGSAVSYGYTYGGTCSATFLIDN